mmetsp:Transcript_44846/g.114651  ORF Transcript_44846/g.114651 Transcript_44846/m.114651 type:complete len:136 (+) Transcript_44846:315-722(+)
MLLWAMTQGRGEDFAEAMAKRHFEQRKSAVGGQWIQEAAEEAGLGAVEAAALLASDRYADEVWASYERTVALGIRSIPLFLFWPPGMDQAGPFRRTHPQEEDDEIKPHTINGSADPSRFLDVFEAIAREAGAPLS